jgi:type II secretory pathway predicted ATPase ExeA
LRIREAAARVGSGTVLLFCDEAQRYNENEYEWLRDVHDALDRQQIKLFTFLVGQQELLAQKTALQVACKTQIVARQDPKITRATTRSASTSHGTLKVRSSRICWKPLVILLRTKRATGRR